MGMESGRSPLRFSLAAVGPLLFAFDLLLRVAASVPLLRDPLEIAVIAVFSLIVTVAGVAAARRREPSEVWLQTRAAVAVALVAAVFGAIGAGLLLREGLPAPEAVAVVPFAAATGAIVGTVLGEYECRRRAAVAMAELARIAVANTTDGIAILDDDIYRFVNDAHADQYGCDDPDEQVGKEWRQYYPAAEQRRFETEVLPALEETGTWRGEATGRRPDGEEFPQELSLTRLHDGRLVCVVRDISDRRESELLREERRETLESLHTATREMATAGDPEAVCERAITAATETLGAELVGAWLVDDTDTRLVPVAHNEESAELLGELPTFTADGTSVSWNVFTSGERRVISDIREESDAYNPESPIRSEVIVPLGEFGVLSVGSTAPKMFDEADIRFIRLLAENTTAALAGARRERTLRIRTEQMEFFTSILRHDVRNGVTVIRGRAELLAEQLDGDDADDADTIVRWADDMDGLVQRVSDVLDALTDEGDRTRLVDLSGVADTVCERIDETYPEVTVERDLPGRTPAVADDLLAEVVGNLVTNAVEHNETEGLVVSVSVSVAGDPDPEYVTLRVADNGRGVPIDRREAVFQRSESTSDSGFGLFFVDAMVDAYGGDVWVEENDSGGAAFVVRLPAPDEPT